MADAQDLLAFIIGIGGEGLDPRDYDPAGLSAAIQSGDSLRLAKEATERFNRVSSDLAFGHVRGEDRQQWFITDMARMVHYELEKVSGGIRVRLSPQLYFAPNNTAIGALRFEQGMFLNTGLKVLGLDAMAKVMAELGHIDCLVNNAALMYDQLTATWDEFLAVNFMGIVHASNAVVPYLWEQGSGSIVNISSTAAFPIPLPEFMRPGPDSPPSETCTVGSANFMPFASKAFLIRA